MSLNSNEFRRIINLLENVNSSETLEEGPILNKIAAKLGSNAAKGRVDRDNLIKPMYAGYKSFLGRTGRTGTLDDVQKYLSQVGFQQQQVQQITAGHSSTPASAADPTKSTNAASASTAGQADDSDTTPAPASATPPQDNANTDAAPASDIDIPAPPKPFNKNNPAPPPPKPAPAPTGTPSSTPKVPPGVDPKSVAKMNRRDHDKSATLHYNRMDHHDQKSAEAGLKHRSLNHDPVAQEAQNKIMHDHSQKSSAHRALMNYHRTMAGNGTRAESIKNNKPTLNEFKISNPPLPKNDIKAIFTKAAEFAYDNELVKNKVSQLVGNNSSGGQFGGYNSNTSNDANDNQNNNNNNSNNSNNNNNNNSNNNTADNNQNNNRNNTGNNQNNNTSKDYKADLHDKVLQQCMKDQLTQQDIRDLRNTASSVNSISKVTDKTDIYNLAIIGFSFLKTQ